MFSKDINSGELNYIYSEENFLDINKVKTTKTKKKRKTIKKIIIKMKTINIQIFFKN